MLSSQRCAQLGLAAAGVVLASSLGVLFASSSRHAPLVVVATSPAETAPTITAPSFHLKDLDGRSYDSDGLRGKAVVMFFSSMRCVTCTDYQERVGELARSFQGDSRVQFLSLNQDLTVGDPQRLLEVRVFTKVREVPFPTLLDVNAETSARFGAAPAQFAVLDPGGIVRYLGGFDDNRDEAKVTRHFVADELRRILDDMPTAVAAR